MLTLIYEDAAATIYERITADGVVVETIPKNPDRNRPSYKAAAVKIAAEKLALTPIIESALDALINADGDKALLVWWIETDAISRGDAQWQRVEGAVSWGKSSADDLFALAAQV